MLFRSAGHFDGAVIVNVEPRWLLEGISGFSGSADEQFYLMSSNREFVLGNQMDADESNLDSVRAVYYDQIQSKIDSGIPSGMIPCELDGEKNMLSFIHMPLEDFVLFKIQSFDSIYASINQIKVTMRVITSGVLLMAILVSFVVSRKIYKPFDQFLANIVGKHPQHELPERRRVDELGYLENVYIRSVNEISTLKNEITSADTIKRKYYLVQLFINSGSITENEISELCRSGMMRVNIRSSIVLSMLRLNLPENLEPTVQEATVWCSEILGGQLGGRYRFDVVDLNNGALVILANPGQEGDAAAFAPIMEKALERLKELALQRYGITIDAAVGDPVHAVADISEAYFDLQKMLAYVYAYGRDVVITSSRIAENLNDTSLKYPEQEEKKLLREIMAQNLGMIGPALDDLIQKVHGMSYSNLVVSLVRLCTTIQSTIETIKRENFCTSMTESLGVNPMEYPTLMDLRSRMYEYIHSGIAEDIIVSRHKRMIEAVKEIVKKRYCDPALCLAIIADDLRITPNYLNHNFKIVCGMSVSEYITDFRLVRSAELIKTTDESMNAIMNEVGIENESFFYKRFKEKYGTTPKNYKTTRLCDQYVKLTE